MTRVGADDEVSAAPGERGVLEAVGTTIRVHVAESDASQEMASFTGDDWPTEVIILNSYTSRVLQLIKSNGYSPVDFYMPGGSGTVSSLELPETCKLAVLTIRKLPVPLRASWRPMVWMVSAEFFG